MSTELNEPIADARLIWDYHLMEHELVSTDIGLGLGSHDIGVAEAASELFNRDIFPLLVFSGATSKTTAAIFPDGEAVAYRKRAIELGVPADRIRIETEAGNTGANFSNSKALLSEEGIHPRSLTVICKPYMQRRAFATCRQVWPEVEVYCYSESLSFDEYLISIRDEKLVIDMLVGDLQRIWLYAEQGFAVPQDVPQGVRAAFDRLVAAGYTSRLAS